MVMEIVEGKFYKTRDGRKAEVYKIEKMAYDGVLLANFNTEDGGNFVVYADTGRGNGIHGEDYRGDLIAEWQDEQKKEISDMSEVKFKVGDLVTQKETRDYVYKVIAIDKEGLYTIEIVEDRISSMVGKIYSAVTDRNLEIYKVSFNNFPKPNTKWVFNDGQDFVVRVVGFNDKGQIVLETVLDKHGFDLGNYFTFENEPEKFGEFYKPWVEKQKSLVGYVSVVKEIGTGRLDFDGSVFDTEQGARDSFDSWDGAWELVDVVKVEWEQP